MQLKEELSRVNHTLVRYELWRTPNRIIKSTVEVGLSNVQLDMKMLQLLAEAPIKMIASTLSDPTKAELLTLSTVGVSAL